MSNGWYLMHRGWMQSRDFRPEAFTDREAYQWSIEQAAHTPHRQWFNGTLYDVERGEFITSLHAMGTAFQWSDKRVRGFTQRMVKAEKWAKQGAHAGAKAPTRLVVVNYDEFQRPPREWGKARGEAEGERGAKQGQNEGEEQKEGITNSDELKPMGEKIEAAPPALSLPYREAIEMWTQAATLKGWEPVAPRWPLNDKRRNGLAKVLKAYGIDGWRAGLQRAVDSAWLGDADPPPWFNLSFVCNLDNFTKLYEGNYDRSFTSNRSEQRSPWLDAREKLSASQL